MLTTDFSGTYDYEKEEAKHAANYILEDLYDGYLTLEELPERILKERTHWKKCIPETFDDFNKYFTNEINKGIEGLQKTEIAF